MKLRYSKEARQVHFAWDIKVLKFVTNKINYKLSQVERLS